MAYLRCTWGVHEFTPLLLKISQLPKPASHAEEVHSLVCLPEGSDGSAGKARHTGSKIWISFETFITSFISPYPHLLTCRSGSRWEGMAGDRRKTDRCWEHWAGSLSTVGLDLLHVSSEERSPQLRRQQLQRTSPARSGHRHAVPTDGAHWAAGKASHILLIIPERGLLSAIKAQLLHKQHSQKPQFVQPWSSASKVPSICTSEMFLPEPGCLASRQFSNVVPKKISHLFCHFQQIQVFTVVIRCS